MNPVEMLETDHRKVEALFERLAKAKNADGRARTFLEIKAALTEHAVLEECIFYVAARTTDSTEAQVLVSDAYADHDDMKNLLAQIEVMSPDSEGFAFSCRRLQALVASHVAREEQALFPQARKVLGPDRMGAVAERMAAVRSPRGAKR